ncbi:MULTISPECIES: hypothetical protein [unclassified Candidatus Tisiphia]
MSRVKNHTIIHKIFTLFCQKPYGFSELYSLTKEQCVIPANAGI